MNTMYCPYTTDYIVIREPIISSIQTNGMGSIRIYGKIHEVYQTQWELLPGEWYELGSILYPRGYYAEAYNFSAILGLKLDRSKKGRKWVKEKMTKLSLEYLQTNQFRCYDRTAKYLSSDLNGKVALVKNRESAIEYSKVLLGEYTCTTDQKRWDLIIQAV